MAGESFWDKLSKEGIAALLVEGVRWVLVVGAPIVVAIVTAAAGWLQGLPIAYIICAVVIAAAMTATALLRFEDWRTRRTPANKVTFNGAQAIFDYSRDPTNGQITGLIRGQTVLLFQNTAGFPLSYIVDTLASSIDNRINTDMDIIRSGIIPPSSILQYRPKTIDLHDVALR